MTHQSFCPRPGLRGRGLIGAVVFAAAIAGGAHAADLTVTDAVIRAVGPGVPNTAGYMLVANAGAKPDQLISAACACARKVDVHLSHVMNGMSMMMDPGPLPVPAHGSLRFSPGGYHLMITGLKAPLADGAIQPIDLKFKTAGTISVAFSVKSRIDTASAKPMSMPMGH